MSFPLPNNLLQHPDTTVKEIMKKAAAKQNGEVSRAMKKMGLRYKINYGVTIPQLRDLATRYQPDKSLAVLLRQQIKIREAIILGSMLDEPDKLSLAECVSISELVTNNELVEQYSRNLFARLPNVFPFIQEMVKFEETKKALAYRSVGWAIKFGCECNSENMKWLLTQLAETNEVADIQIGSAILFVMQAIDSNQKLYAEQVHNLAEKYSKCDNRILRQFGNEFLWLNVE